MQLQKTSALRNLFILKAPLLCANHFFLINHTRKCFWHSNLNEPQKKNCLNNNLAFRGRNSTKFWIFWIIVIQMSSLFIHVTNFKITITNLNSKFYIYYLKSWHFLKNWVSNFLEERSSTICASSSCNLRMKNWNQ